MRVVTQGSYRSASLQHVARAIDQVALATSISEVANSFARYGNMLGFSRVSLHDDIREDHPIHNEDGQGLHHCFNWPPEMAEKWFGRQLIRYSRDAHECRVRSAPFLSRVVCEPSGSLPESDVELQQHMTSIGISTVIIVPVHRPHARISMAGWATDAALDGSDCDALSPWLLLASHMAVEKMARLKPAEAPVECRLPKRQLECLTMAASGKTAKEIGSALGISPLTVNDHLKFCAQRLNARNRAELVARAYELGIIHT